MSQWEPMGDNSLSENLLSGDLFIWGPLNLYQNFIIFCFTLILYFMQQMALLKIGTVLL
jgi:hypothetical protein